MRCFDGKLLVAKPLKLKASHCPEGLMKIVLNKGESTHQSNQMYWVNASEKERKNEEKQEKNH